MAKKNQKMVEEITAMDVDFAQWYTDICKKAELVSYTSVKGCMVIRPYGYAIWENIQRILDGMFKATGHVNVNMPMFIPESLLEKEKDHVEGFAPEVAWVTYGGSEKLEERLCVRPTSETLFCDHYKDIVHSCTTSGSAWYAGKRLPVRSCVPVSSCGRKATPFTPPQRRQLKKPSVC